MWRPGIDMRFDTGAGFITKVAAGQPSTFASRPFLEGIVRRSRRRDPPTSPSASRSASSASCTTPAA